MRKSITAAFTAVTMVGMLAMPASANNTREANCEALGGTVEPGVGNQGQPLPAHDRCLRMVATGVTFGDWTQVGKTTAALGDTYTTASLVSRLRVNSGNAKQIVNNVTYTVDTLQLMQDTVTFERDVVTSYAQEALHYEGNRDTLNIPSAQFTGVTSFSTDQESQTEVGAPYTVKIGESSIATCKENSGSPDRGNACPAFAN